MNNQESDIAHPNHISASAQMPIQDQVNLMRQPLQNWLNDSILTTYDLEADDYSEILAAGVERALQDLYLLAWWIRIRARRLRYLRE